jgi:hypothetical protein
MGIFVRAKTGNAAEPGQNGEPARYGSSWYEH